MGNKHNSTCLAFSTSKSLDSDHDLVNYIASYKPGRKLVFRNLYYQEGNSLLKYDAKTSQSELLTPISKQKNPDRNEEEEKENIDFLKI